MVRRLSFTSTRQTQKFRVPPAPAAPFAKTAKQREVDRLILETGATHILLRGGSRSTKTFYIVRAITARALRAPQSRHGIFRQHLNHLRASIWADTFPKVMRLAFPGVPYTPNKQDMVVYLPNGSEIVFGGLDDKQRTEKILGQEYATTFCNEISQMSFDSRNMLLTRLAQNAPGLKLREFLDCNPPPKSHWSYQLFFKRQDPKTGHTLSSPQDYATLQLNPRDNPHLPEAYIKILQGLPPRERQRFLDGEYTEGAEGALWEWGMFARPDRNAFGKYILPDMRRIIVAVDPPAKSGASGAEAGIVVVGEGTDGLCYVLADGSTKGRPEFWARAAVNLYHHWRADGIVAEINNGGEMVASTIKAVDDNVPVHTVHASRGKVKRAEPVAQLYTEGKVFHAGDFGELETQMTEFTVDFDVDAMGYSPDRVDAAVWGVTEIMLGESRGLQRARVGGT